MFVEEGTNWKGDNFVINENYHYFITIHHQQLIMSFYNILNTVKFNYNLHIYMRKNFKTILYCFSSTGVSSLITAVKPKHVAPN
jgi:hypothetical protein